MEAMRLSLLDRANTVEGTGDGDALRRVVDRAVAAEELGYRRIFVAEHHGVPGIAGSAPGILAAAIGQATTVLRVGTAGIMVPDHAPIVVAEHAAVLESLYPGRVDIGLGSSVGFTAAVRRALGQDEDAAVAGDGYLGDVDEILSYLRADADVTLRPALDSLPELYLLTGGSPETLGAAERRGMGVIIGGRLDKWAPGAIVSATVAVAGSEEDARDLVLPEIWAQVLARSTGSFEALRPVGELDEAALTAQQRRRVSAGLDRAIYGTADDVAGKLREVAQRTGADELLVSGGMSDVDGQRRSDAMLAELVV